MQNRAIVCLASAVLGGVVAVLLQRSLDVAPLSANEPTARVARGQRLGARQVPSVDWSEPDESAAASFTPDEMTNIAVYENCNRSVVNINTKTRTEALLIFELQTEGAGSGVVLDRQGDVLTNYHVVEGARLIQVTLYDGKQYEAKLIGGDRSSDLAVLRIDAPQESLFPIELGDSAALLVGQRVFAIGNPFGLERTLTTGIISSLNRTLPARNGRSIKSVIQIDAAINPGSSGGPLLDSRGRLIGINTAIASATGQSAGVGFAVPVNTVKRVVPQLITAGRVVRPEIGILKVLEVEEGLLVVTLTPGGPAERAGMRGPRIERKRKLGNPFAGDRGAATMVTADVITEVDGQPIKLADDFLAIIESKQPGDDVEVTVKRDPEPAKLIIRLAPGE